MQAREVFVLASSFCFSSSFREKQEQRARWPPKPSPLLSAAESPALRQPLPKAEGDAVLLADSPLLSVSVKQAWVKLPKFLPGPVLLLSCLTVYAISGDVAVHLV